MAGAREFSGVPTVADRIAQTVVAMALEARTESIFHDDSYGYRPRRSALDAVARCRQRCWEKDWVIDLDVAKFFDRVDHGPHGQGGGGEITTDQQWVVLYVKRWLVAPLQHARRDPAERDRGTPQGSAVSPVLANLFMHYAFDAWLAREFPAVEFERYADDAVVHCATERQAREVLAALAERMEEVGLRLHPDKTRIVYCKDATGGVARSSTRRSRSWGTRSVPAKPGIRTGRLFTSFLPAVSAEALKAMGQRVRRWRIHMRTRHDLGRARRMDQPDRGGLDDVLRPVLPVGAVSLPATHQHLPDALGPEEVQAAALVQAASRPGGPGSSIETPVCSAHWAWQGQFCWMRVRRAE